MLYCRSKQAKVTEMRIVIDLDTNMAALLTDYCVDNQTSPQDVVGDMMAALLCHPSDMVIEDTTVTVAEMIYMFCRLMDASDAIEFADAELAESAVMLRANLHEFYLSLLDS